MPISKAEKQRRKTERRATRPPLVTDHPCTATTLAGKPCPNAAATVTLPLTGRKLDTENGVKKRVRLTTCLSHAPRKIRDAIGFGGPVPGSGRKPKPSVPQLMREMVEEHAHEVMQVYFEGLTAEKPVVVGNGAHATLEMVRDDSVRMRAGDALLDRVYGKPKQTTEMTGSGGGPVRVQLPDNDERARLVAEALRDADA